MYIQRLFRASFFLGVIAICVASLVPVEELPSIEIWDKLEHALAYGAVAALGAAGWAGRRRAWLMLGFGLAALGGMLEIAQSFVPGRMTDAGDALANVVGVVAGIVTVASVTRVAAGASRLGQTGR